eukprot:scaffold118064_cov17-Tisochrysis_lutea.AAC.1
MDASVHSSIIHTFYMHHEYCGCSRGPPGPATPAHASKAARFKHSSRDMMLYATAACCGWHRQHCTVQCLLPPHKQRLSTHIVQRLPPPVPVPIPRGALEVLRAHTVLSESCLHLAQVVRNETVDGGEDVGVLQVLSRLPYLRVGTVTEDTACRCLTISPHLRICIPYQFIGGLESEVGNPQLQNATKHTHPTMPILPRSYMQASYIVARMERQERRSWQQGQRSSCGYNNMSFLNQGGCQGGGLGREG